MARERGFLNMGKIVFVLGGARSGKSSFALKLAAECGKSRVAFVATSQALDTDMAGRIDLHKKTRPAHWRTFEEPLRVCKIIESIGGKFDCIIIDCMTLLVSNLYLKKVRDTRINHEAKRIVASLKKTRANSVIVSNEVGLGVVPPSKMGRDFRDIAGNVNKIIASKADSVYFMVSGLPLKVK